MSRAADMSGYYSDRCEDTGMAPPMEIFELYRYAGDGGGCRHDLLVRVDRPGYRNSDQGAENAAGAYADSLCAHLRSWWQRWVLPRTCTAAHTEARLGVVDGEAEGDELYGPGLRVLPVRISESPYPGAVVIEVSGDGDDPEVFLLTDQTGRLDLSSPSPD